MLYKKNLIFIGIILLTSFFLLSYIYFYFFFTFEDPNIATYRSYEYIDEQFKKNNQNFQCLQLYMLQTENAESITYNLDKKKITINGVNLDWETYKNIDNIIINSSQFSNLDPKQLKCALNIIYNIESFDRIDFTQNKIWIKGKGVFFNHDYGIVFFNNENNKTETLSQKMYTYILLNENWYMYQ